MAFAFYDLHREEGYQLIGVASPGVNYVSHVYVTDGKWAFDFNGWTLEEQLLETTRTYHRQTKPNWNYKRILIETDLEAFCKTHRSRSPAYYFKLPWERAYNFIDQFPTNPPS